MTFYIANSYFLFILFQYGTYVNNHRWNKIWLWLKSKGLSTFPDGIPASKTSCQKRSSWSLPKEWLVFSCLPLMPRRYWIWKTKSHGKNCDRLIYHYVSFKLKEFSICPTVHCDNSDILIIPVFDAHSRDKQMFYYQSQTYGQSIWIQLFQKNSTFEINAHIFVLICPVYQITVSKGCFLQGLYMYFNSLRDVAVIIQIWLLNSPWNCFQANVIGLHLWEINIGAVISLLPSGN